MAVPTVITELTTTLASNSPAGSESAATVDDYLRAHAGFIAQLYAVIGQTAALTASRALATDASAAFTATAVTSAELGYLSGVTSALQTQLNAKAAVDNPTFTTRVTTPEARVSGATASRAAYFDANKDLKPAATTATELGYVNGVTSAIQTQLNAKAPADSPTFTTAMTIPSAITGAPTFSGLVKARGGGNGLGQITISTSAPSGGANGDLWFKY